MQKKITKQSIIKIAQTLGISEYFVVKKANLYRFEVFHNTKKYKLIIEIWSNISSGKNKGFVVCVISPLGVSQLHFLSGYILSQELGEVVFFTETSTTISAFIIGKDASFNSYMNVSKFLLKQNLLKVDPVFVSCMVQLGLVEHQLNQPKKKSL